MVGRRRRVARARLGLGALRTSSSLLTTLWGSEGCEKGRGEGVGHLAWSGRPPLPWNTQQPDHGLIGLFIIHSLRTCPQDSTPQVGKYFPNVQDFNLGFKPQSAEASVITPKRGFVSLKSHWGGDARLASRVCKSWSPRSCQEPVRI